MKKRPSDTELANVALGYVLPLARNELMNLSMDSRLRLERSSLSASAVQNFTGLHVETVKNISVEHVMLFEMDINS
jgi:hypothetical protein